MVLFSNLIQRRKTTPGIARREATASRLDGERHVNINEHFLTSRGVLRETFVPLFRGI
jgi:hypothetical protein